MKPLLIILTGILFFGCRKPDNSVCMKGEIIAADCCGAHAVNITEGPAIGVKYLTYNNVIQIYNISTANWNFGSPGTTIYFKVRNIRAGDLKPCLSYCPQILGIPVSKIATSVSLTPCR